MFYIVLFAARSTKGIKRFSKSERAVLNLNDNEMSAVTGMMLSDGHISLRSPTANARFHFSQSGKQEKQEYFNLVLSIMSIFCTLNFVPYVREWTDSSTNTIYTSISFATMQLPCFTELRNLWYLNGIKIIPLNIKEMLTPIAMAHWIMWDGSKQNEGLHLSVYAFSSSDVNLLIDALSSNFNLKCIIHNTDRGPRIYINNNSMDILRPIVSPYIVSSMNYKIGL